MRNLHYGLIGFSAYAYAIRFRGLLPTNVDWIFRDAIGDVAGFDSTANYLGWEFFRRGAFLVWPVGRSTLLGPEPGASIAMTDSLPLLGIPVKYLTWWTDQPLQYFGVWILLCFVLQALFAGRILQKFISSHVAVLTAVVLFPLMPVYLSRVGVHTPLSGQWVVLAALALLLSSHVSWGRWLVLNVVAMAVQPYLGAMVLLLCSCRVFAECWVRRTIAQNQMLTLGVSALGSSLTAHQIGLFVFGSGSLQAGGFGDFSANVLSLVDPLSDSASSHTSSWSQRLLVPNVIDGTFQYEGFGFVGTGIALVATAVAMNLVVRSRRRQLLVPLILVAVLMTSAFSDISWQSALMLVSLAVVFVYFVKGDGLGRSSRVSLSVALAISIVVSLTNVVMIGDRQVVYPWPDALQSFLATVRVTGRFIWIVTYVCSFAVIVMLFRSVRSLQIALVMIALTVTVQMFDSDYAVFRQRELLRVNRTSMGMESALWVQIGERYRAINFVLPRPAPNLENPSGGQDQSTLNEDFWFAKRVLWADLGEFAAFRGLAMNAFYFGRDPRSQYQLEASDLKRVVENQSYQSDALYVFIDSALWNQAKTFRRDQDVVGLLDGIPIVAPNLRACTSCSFDDVVQVRPLGD